MIIIYHNNCADGFCAAWVARHVFGAATFIPMNYGEPPPDVTGEDVMILDFSFKRPVLEEMRKKAKSFVVLDHHKSAKDDLEGFPNCVFDMNKSGARITFEYLQEYCLEHGIHEKLFVDAIDNRQESPWLVNYTEDRDLWRWQLRGSKEVNAVLRTFNYDFQVWDNLHTNSIFFNRNSPTDECLNIGRALLRAEKQIIDLHVSRARPVKIAMPTGENYNVFCVNTSVLTSEICGELAKRSGTFGLTYFDNEKGERIWSLRSLPHYDVLPIAISFGGGGHRNAAGFQGQFPGRIIG